MKTLYLLTATWMVIALSSCKNDDAANGTDNLHCSVQVPCGNPNGLISVAEADEMEQAYLTEFYGRIQETMSGSYPNYEGAGRYIWFELDEVKQYIAYMEQHVNDKGYKGKLGLRVYMGTKYQENQSNGSMEPRQTVFFVPTINPSNGDDLQDNLNIVSADRLNLGGAGVPDDMFQSTGLGN